MRSFNFSAGGGQEHEADLATVQEMEPEVRPPVSQQQDEALLHNVATHDQNVTSDFWREDGIKQHLFEQSRGYLLLEAVCFSYALVCLDIYEL